MREDTLNPRFWLAWFGINPFIKELRRLKLNFVLEIKSNSKHARSWRTRAGWKAGAETGIELPVPGTTRPRSGLISGAARRD